MRRAENDRLYYTGRLATARSALRPSGVLAMWSAALDALFAGGFNAVGFQVVKHVVRARSTAKVRDT